MFLKCHQDFDRISTCKLPDCFEEDEILSSGICSGSRVQEPHFKRQSQATPMNRTKAVKDDSSIIITILPPPPSFFFPEISTPKGFTIVPLLP